MMSASMVRRCRLPMTPRERWLALLNGQKPDRIPSDYWATGEVTERLMKELGCATHEALWEKLHIDRITGLDATRTMNSHPDDPRANIWGLR